MKTMMTIAAAFLLTLRLSCPGWSQTGGDIELRILSWNISNLVGTSGEALFPGRSFERTERDYNALRKYIQHVRPSLVALQEVGDLSGARKVLPSRFHFFPSVRMFGQSRAMDDLFPLVAYDPEKVRLLAVSEVAPPTASSVIDGEVYFTRSFPAGLFEVDGLLVWFVSVHLKQGCENTKVPVPLKADHVCAPFLDQIRSLDSWMKRVSSNADIVVFSGDFNRRLPPSGIEGDSFLSVLAQNYGDMRRSLVSISERRCNLVGITDTRPIDYTVIYPQEDIKVDTSEVLIAGEDMSAGYDLSDHCAILLKINL